MPVSNGYQAFLARWAVAAIVLGTSASVRAGDPAVLRDIPKSSSLNLETFAPTDTSSGWIQRNFITNTIFDDAGIKVRGYAEAGYSSNWDRPNSGLNGYGILFNDKSDDLTFNQLSLIIQRDPVPSADTLDVGYKIQVLYGSDARYTQANGTNFYGSRWANDLDNSKIPPLGSQIVTTGGTIAIFRPVNTGPGQPLKNAGQPDPENQLDVFQAYLSINVPTANGVLVNAGKFETPWGYEHVDPTLNQFYSHSYLFALTQPRTLTGLTAELTVNDDWQVMGGIVVGWNQSLEDNNDFPSFVAQTKYHLLLDEQYAWDFALSAMVGPEMNDNRSDYRWSLDLTGKVKISDITNFGFQAVVGYETDSGTTYHEAFDLNSGTFVDALIYSGGDALWYGGAIYGDIKLDHDGMFLLVGRAEGLSDNDGGRALAGNVFSVTLGLNVFPFIGHEIGKDLMFRPEIRWDTSDQKLYDDYTRVSQLTFNADLVYKF